MKRRLTPSEVMLIMYILYLICWVGMQMIHYFMPTALTLPLVPPPPVRPLSEDR